MRVMATRPVSGAGAGQRVGQHLVGRHRLEGDLAGGGGVLDRLALLDRRDGLSTSTVSKRLGAVVGALDVQEDQYGAERGDDHGDDEEDACGGPSGLVPFGTSRALGDAPSR